jgi:hypothetical protein
VKRATRRPAPGAPEGAGAAAIAIAGERFLADPAGALYWPDRDTLIVADLHLEKGSAGAARGRMLPPYDTRETLARLAGALERSGAATVIALGDSTHDEDAGGRITSGDLEALRALQRGRRWIWVAGNHDRRPPACLAGERAEALAIGGIALRHEPAPDAAATEIAAHLHPVARVAVKGASLRRPCFAGNGRRLVLPAFGAFTGGLNVLDPAFAPVLGGAVPDVWVLGRDGPYRIAPDLLRPD